MPAYLYFQPGTPGTIGIFYVYEERKMKSYAYFYGINYLLQKKQKLTENIQISS